MRVVSMLLALAGCSAQELFLERSLQPENAIGRSAGILYEVWHGPAAEAMRQVKAMGHEQLTVETVLRSDGQKTLNDVYGPSGIGGDIWNVEPAELGFYCLYTKRPSDENPPQPDCNNATGVAKRHAQLLTHAGFDYIAVDITNWPKANKGTDHQVLRPLEVLMDAWVEMRAEGEDTPYVVPWPKAPVESYDDSTLTTWQWLLDNVYNHPTRRDLVWKRPGNSGKKTFFVTATADRNLDVDALIAANGGRSDVEVIGVWAMMGKASYDRGTWGFFSECRSASGAATTSMVGEADCNQFTSKGPDGQTVEISASGAYMTAQCSLPFASPGHMRGLTLQRLFKKILEESPPNVFMSSFNEHIGGRQAPGYAMKSAIAFNMGLPDDPQAKQVWVDTYAAEYSRDIEPTVEAGDTVFQVASSCLKMYKAGQTCSDAETREEPCCTVEDKEIWSNVWSLKRNDGSDRLLTTGAGEKAALVHQGAWTEVCNAVPGPSVFCVNGATTDGRDGPFMLYNRADAVVKSVPIYRCNIGAKHFFSPDSSCEGQEVESLLGYASAARGGETLRKLRRCYFKSQGGHTHALDAHCPEESVEDSVILGFVK